MKEQDRFPEEIHSLKKMTENFPEVYENICGYQKINDTDNYHRDPLPVLEYQVPKAEWTSNAFCPR